MRNRAKCKVCLQIIESLGPNDYVTCRCGQIGISGGSESFKTFAFDYDQFLRVDDDGKEISVEVKDKMAEEKVEEPPKKITREDIISQVDYLIGSYEGLPPHALTAPTTHADLYSVLLLLSASLRLDLPCK